MNRQIPSRQSLLCRPRIGAIALAGLWMACLVASGADPAQPVTRLSEHLSVYHGPINVGIVRDGPKALLIDCGDGSVADALPGLGITAVDRILFTHHHRDQACGAHALAQRGAQIVVPAAERASFDKVADYWNNPKSRWYLTRYHPHHLSLAEPVPVHDAVADEQTFTWGPAAIRVLATPGHTDGSVCYLVEVDGRRVAFSGDSIYDEGQVWDIHSLQKGVQTGDYHGFLGSRPRLTASLQKVKQAGPATLVPSHGRIMPEPAKAIDALVERLDLCYDKYVAIAALRHYFPKVFVEYAGRPDHMPIRPGLPPPDCLRHFSTTWVLVSKDKSALVMDCWGQKVIDFVKELIAKGDVRTVEGLWVTHYHSDHVDGIPQFQQTFDCPCITDRHVAEVIANPMAWRLPCISPNKARVDRPTRDGESWQWREFKLTAYHLPGQTLYHAGLLVEGQGLRMFFIGDSFTMAGIDDYCPLNRTWLGRGVGFDRCIALIERLRPTHMFNPHVKDAFTFTPEECRFMRDNLAQREVLFGQLVPWEHANYGMDEPWVRADPYEQQAAAGQEVNFQVVVTNHAAKTQPTACRAVLPRAWGGQTATGGATTAWVETEIPAKTDGRLGAAFRIPSGTPAGRYVVPVDVRHGRWSLPQFAEAIVVVGEM